MAESIVQIGRQAESGEGVESRNAGRWTPGELLLLSACVAYLLILARVASRGVPFWIDEVLGWMLGADPSLRHMLYSWNHGVDGGGIGFYLLERGWFWIFGASDASYRFFSAIGFAAGFCVTWAVARQLFSAGVVALSMILTWLFSSILNIELALARFYGLFILSAGLVVLSYLRSTRLNDNSVGNRSLTFAGHVLMVSVHVLGVLYSGATLLALLVDDRRRGRMRPALYLSVIASWGVIALSFKGLRSAASVGKPHFWIEKPRLHDLLSMYHAWSPALLAVGAAATCVWCLRILSQKTGWAEFRGPRAEDDRSGIWVLVAAWYCVPLFLFCYSRVADPIFMPRYFLPVVVPVTLVVAEVLRRTWPPLDEAQALRRPAVWVLMVVIALLLAGNDAKFLEWKRSGSAAGYREQIESMAPPHLPVVFDSAYDFTEVLPRQRPGSEVRYRFLLDWPDALDPKSPRPNVANYHLMENWKTVGYYSDDIQYAESFLRQTGKFVVVNDETHRWLQRRIFGNPNYECRKIGEVRNGRDGESVWIVTRAGNPVGSTK